MKTVIKGYKYRIYPTEEQKELINKTFDAQDSYIIIS
jgi:transposase